MDFKAKVDLLGSTGSIGEQAVDVIRKENAQVSSICANTNYKRVEEQAREFKPAFCAMFNEKAAKELTKNYNVTVATSDGAEQLIIFGSDLFNDIIGQIYVLAFYTLQRNTANIRSAFKRFPVNLHTKLPFWRPGRTDILTYSITDTPNLCKKKRN